MKKHLLVALLFALTIVPALAKTDSLLKSDQIKLNAKLFGLSLTYEKRVGDKFTIVPEVSIMTDNGLDVSRYNFSQGMRVIRATVGFEGRYYYNFAARAKNGKSTINNSANYISLGGHYAFKPLNETDFNYDADITIDGTTYFAQFPIKEYYLFSLAPTWGIQRKVGSKFSLDLNLGASLNYFSDYKEWVVGPAIGFRMGYVIK